MTIGDLIDVRSVPTIVDPGDVADLRARLRTESPPSAETDEALCALTEHYYVLDAHNRVALETLLRSFAGARNESSERQSKGAGFFINGVYGSGKSHLLALLAFVAEFPAARTSFLRAHEEFTREVEALAGRRTLVVYLSLEDYAPPQFSLETIFWRETRAQAAQQLLKVPDFATDASRSEQFAAFEHALIDAKFGGAVWLIDELSMFLSARRGADLQADASFLQFVGQRIARGPYWFVAALQKNVEDVGELDPYSLSQIRDRFNTRLMLSLAHVRTLIRMRLIVGRTSSPDALDPVSDRLQQRLPRLDFGPEDLTATYPFHPATIDLLEAVASRFFSRTRSALQFAQDVLVAPRLAAKRDCLVTPDELFDYFQPDLEAHPELRQFNEQVFTFYERHARELAPHDPALALRLAKLLIVCKVAGVNPTVAQCANWLLADGGLIGDENYAYVEGILEAFRARGTYVAVERREGAFADVYAIDLGARVNELLRRRIANVAFALEAKDARIASFAFQCCAGNDWPLSPAASERSVWWQNTERHFHVERRDLRALSGAELQQRLESLATATDYDVELFIGDLVGIRQQQEHWLKVAAGANRGETRWSAALVALLPRELTREEHAQLREVTAADLLSHDPELRDNRRGRAILERLAADQAQRESDARQIVVRALSEGEVFLGAQSVLRVSELVSETGSFDDLLRELAERVLPTLLPQFAAISPRLRLPGISACDALALELLRATDRPLPVTTEGLARAVLVPLGVVSERERQFRAKALAPPLRELILREFGDGSNALALSTLEQRLRKCEYGLPAELTRLCVAALLREGEVVADDADETPVALEGLRASLRERIHALRRGQLLSTEDWDRVVSVVNTLIPTAKLEVKKRTLSEQQRARDALTPWREEARRAAELTQVRLAQLRWLAPAAVARAQESLHTWAAVLQAVDDSPIGSVALERTVASLRGSIGDDLAKPLRARAKHAAALNATLDELHHEALNLHAYLSDAELVTAEPVTTLRQAALTELRAEGELPQRLRTFVEAARECRRAYISAYLRWHADVHSPQSLEQVTNMSGHPAVRLVQQMGKLAPGDMEASLQARIVRLPRAIDAAAASVCLQPALEHQLQQRPTCLRCRLRLGQRPTTGSTDELLNEAGSLTREFVAYLSQSPTRDRIERDIPRAEGAEARDLTALMNFDAHASAEQLLPLLNDRVVEQLNRILAPRRRVRRRAESLRNEFAGQTMKREEAVKRFAHWLDGGAGLRDEDEVEFGE